MKIAATMIGMEAAHNYTEVAFQSSGLFTSPTLNTSHEQSFGFGDRLSSLITGSANQTTKPGITNNSTTATDEANQQNTQQSKQLPEKIAEKVIGNGVSLNNTSLSQSTVSNLNTSSNQMVTGGAIKRVSVYSEQETMQFSATGAVLTADGTEINFQFGLEMSRKEVAVTSIATTRMPFFIDPLVLNFDQGIPFSGDTFFSFDIDADGTEEKLSCPGKGCGFLAFDRNLDGIINNGQELFGPATGFGFEELGEYDQDSNLWIDENDPIFDQLSVWMKGDTGDETLLSLKEAGVGAISIVNAGTDFLLKGGSGETIGQVKNSGIFLTEQGEVRSLQEVDLADMNENQKESELTEQASALELAMGQLREIIQQQQLQLKLLFAKRSTIESTERFLQHFQSQLRTSALSIKKPASENWFDSILRNPT